MRAGFVFTAVVVASAFGFIVAALESRLLVRALVVGFVPTIWGVSHVLDRLTRGDMWLFTAPYPYRAMRERGETGPSRPHAARTPVETALATNDHSTLRLAA
jgi:hypothetical protein